MQFSSPIYFLCSSDTVSHKDFYTKFCVCPHKKDIKHIDRTIHSVACVMHKWCDLGMLAVKNLGVEICDDAKSTARSSKQFLLLTRALL